MAVWVIQLVLDIKAPAGRLDLLSDRRHLEGVNLVAVAHETGELIGTNCRLFLTILLSDSVQQALHDLNVLL